MFSFAFKGGLSLAGSQETAVCCWETGLLGCWRLPEQPLNSFVPMSSAWALCHLCHCRGNVLPSSLLLLAASGPLCNGSVLPARKVKL